MNWHDYYIYDGGLLISKNTGEVLCNVTDDGYLRVRNKGKEYRGHRIIWEMFNGPIPKDMLIDHIDGNKLNNCIENLRIATRIENNSNRVGTSKLGLPKGISKNGSKYRVRLMYEGKVYCLGTYKTIEEAVNVYNDKSKELRGEFHRPSEIPTCKV
jgi:hypothetical protein